MVWEVFNIIADGAFMSFENIVLLLVVLGGLIFYAKGFQMGVTLHFFIASAVFIWFYTAGLWWTAILIFALTMFVIMAISLYFSINISDTGGFV